MEILKQITEAEKAALTYRYYNGEKTFKNAYLIAFPDRKNTNPDSLASRVSHWKNSPEIQKYCAEIELKDKQRILKLAEIQNKTKTETKTNTTGSNASTETETNTAQDNGGTFAGTWTDFQDITQFLKFCEIQANTLTDEKDRQTYLKMIADLMRYKDSDNTGQNEVQRFYIPVRCKDCPLYQSNR